MAKGGRHDAPWHLLSSSKSSYIRRLVVFIRYLPFLRSFLTLTHIQNRENKTLASQISKQHSGKQRSATYTVVQPPVFLIWSPLASESTLTNLTVSVKNVDARGSPHTWKAQFSGANWNEAPSDAQRWQRFYWYQQHFETIG